MGNSVWGMILPGTLQTLVDPDSPPERPPTERSRSESEIYRPGVPTVRDGAIPGRPDGLAGLWRVSTARHRMAQC